MRTYDVTLVTYDKFPNLTADDLILREALEKRGLTVRSAIWSDESVDWSDSKTTVLRSMWDYFHRVEEFKTWLNKIEGRIDVFNSVDAVRWNMDKRYLVALEARGVPIVPSLFFNPRKPIVLSEECEKAGWGDVVVKPTVSGSAFGARRFKTSTIACNGQAHIDELLETRSVMVQPYRADVETIGERALVFIGGDYTHGFVKGAFSAGAAAGEFKERPLEAAAPEVAFGKRVLAALGCNPLYARVDFVPTSGGFELMELELIEPSLRFASSAVAVQKLVDLIATRVVSSGASARRTPDSLIDARA